jgi:two-component system, NarL family, nitrate/nitrite response regulator NarL
MADRQTVLVSEKRLFRDGLKEMLQKSRISVVGEGRDIPDLLTTMEQQADPELVICHIAADQPSETGLDLVRGLRRHFAGAKLVVLADACNRSLLSSSVCADVNAILLTDISSEMLQRSLELVLFDHRLFPADIMALITDTALAREADDRTAAGRVIMPAEPRTIPIQAQQVQPAPPNASEPDAEVAVPLSRREHQIIECLVSGLPNKIIARELKITEGTVKVHVKGLLRKIKASNRTQVAIWALRQSALFDARRPVDSMEVVGSAD